MRDRLQTFQEHTTVPEAVITVHFLVLRLRLLDLERRRLPGVDGILSSGTGKLTSLRARYRLSSALRRLLSPLLSLVSASKLASESRSSNIIVLEWANEPKAGT